MDFKFSISDSSYNNIILRTGIWINKLRKAVDGLILFQSTDNVRIFIQLNLG